MSLAEIFDFGLLTSLVSTNKMNLIIGLGNPGTKYKKTRHNIGFMVIDELFSIWQKEYGFEKFKMNKKLAAEISTGKLDNNKIILAKPQTFMNNSGQAVQLLKKYYKIEPKNIWVIHDDIDLPLGKLRIRKNGSAGGHNGIKSIVEHLGTQDFPRFRLGISPADDKRGDASNFVLHKFSRKEQVVLQEVIQDTVGAIEMALGQGVERAMNNFSG